jgi:hypothetical protein
MKDRAASAVHHGIACALMLVLVFVHIFKDRKAAA